MHGPYFFSTGVVSGQSNIITMPTRDKKSEIGFFSGATLQQQQKPLKVKATTASIPVATESLQQKLPILRGKRC